MSSPGNPSCKLVFIGSTGGAVLSRLAGHAFVREMTLEVVADRPCGFVDVARSRGMTGTVIESADGLAFSDALDRRYADTRDIVFLSFYTRLFRGAFLAGNTGRIFNCHPSILPAFKGMHGFEDTLASSSTFMGCTLHSVDGEIDGGTTVIQAALPIDRQLPVAENRHKIFLAQYYSTMQFLRWLADGRLMLDANAGPRVAGACFAPSMFSPNLDPDLFALLGEPNMLG